MEEAEMHGEKRLEQEASTGTIILDGSNVGQGCLGKTSKDGVEDGKDRECGADSASGAGERIWAQAATNTSAQAVSGSGSSGNRGACIFRGVSRVDSEDGKPWRASVFQGRSERCVGNFESAEEAARAWDSAMLSMFAPQVPSPSARSSQSARPRRSPGHVPSCTA
jgi:hypothetical protein